MLRLAGREAAVVGVNAGLRAGVLGRHAVVDFTPERVKEKIGWVHEGAARAGKSPDDITLSVNCWLVRVTPDTASATEFLDRMAAQFDITGRELDASPAVLVGHRRRDLRQVGGVTTRVRVPPHPARRRVPPEEPRLDRADRHHARRNMT